MALRGDARKFDDKFMPEPDGNEYVWISFTNCKNESGKLSGYQYWKSTTNGFCIGVAGYPKKLWVLKFQNGPEVPEKKNRCWSRLHVTQMFLTIKFFSLCRCMSKRRYHVPIIGDQTHYKKSTSLTQFSKLLYWNSDDLVQTNSKSKNWTNHHGNQFYRMVYRTIQRIKNCQHSLHPLLHYGAMAMSSKS